VDFPDIAGYFDTRVAITKLTSKSDKWNDPVYVTVSLDSYNAYQMWLWGDLIQTTTRWKGCILKVGPTEQFPITLGA